MLLRRITKHIKDQNWFAVFLDFLIVVVGVFIGIQVANWNATVTQQQVLDSRLKAVQNELQGNIVLVDSYITNLETAIESTKQFRKVLGTEPQNANLQDINKLFIQSFGVGALSLNMTAYNDLLASEELHLIAGSPLREAMGKYDIALANLERVQADLLKLRDRALSSYLLDNHSFGSAAAQYLNLEPSSFTNDPVLMAEDPRLENLLMGVILIRYHIHWSSSELAKANKALIAELEAR